MNTMFIATIVIIFIFALMGYNKGLFCSGFKLVATILAMLIAYFLAPLFGKILTNHTTLDDYVYKKVYSYIEKQVEEQVVKTLKETFGDDVPLDDTVISATTDAIMKGEADRNQQVSVINELQLPQFVKDAIIQNNNDDTKDQLGATGFYDYLAIYFTDMIIDFLSFVILLLVSTILLRLISLLISAVTELPIVSSVNRLGGLAFGAAEAILIIWVIFVIISFYSYTKTGGEMLNEIESSRFLTALYDKNIVMNLFEGLYK